ncbi:MAG: Y-family DNA polymerase [Candidatus Omnitrophica bacterium]|nr:Y-family DNA polymerase [Candidatus Omnitrophota bacterium]
MNKVFALVDCNSFYVSCERVFNPALKNKPVVVLSNNDGCAISRSQEAKDVGIAMGAPIFQCEELVNRHDVRVFSANFVLYGDMSDRVMSALASFTPNLEIYSIDEAFLSLEGFENYGYLSYGRKIRSAVKERTGIPVSVGIAPTKTLSKVANHIAKDNPGMGGVFCLIDEKDIDRWLEKTPVKEIWGIGAEKALFLNRNGIFNALQLKKAPDEWIKKHLTVVTLRTLRELRGIPSLSFDEPQPNKKAIVTSRTFGYEVSGLGEMQEAVSAYVSKAAQKLRSQNSVAGYVQVFIETNPFKGSYYRNSASIDITPPTAYTPQLVETAKGLLSKIYKEGCRYKSCGVMLTNFSDENLLAQDLFKPVYTGSLNQRLMKVLDEYNRRADSGQLFFAAQGLGKPWFMKQSHKSKRFTTRWDELLEIKI